MRSVPDEKARRRQPKTQTSPPLQAKAEMWDSGGGDSQARGLALLEDA
eukprot:CAMPEP_0204043586 /NCGR_PEP_ID=MMETSP0360-20130528/102274_1 /ASSEMBLY_ACC=CAM_ASM_000342 /TAXON_ID=268821 /ORGANISM="Scrippsiella Hangoei, Strain SHTV-5" /LENGTH=47 /DNA_ID= /DNA_START= /DNA_END= /DNA_ORIENTATION=